MVTILKTTSLLEDSPRKPAFLKATAAAVVRGGTDGEVLWWKAGRWNSSPHKAQVTNNFYIFGIFNCDLFGRNVEPFTDFLLVSCTTVELCCAVQTATL